jgi:hypothetical protein
MAGPETIDLSGLSGLGGHLDVVAQRVG